MADEGKREYTVGYRIPNEANPFLHMTVAFLGELDEKQLDEVKKDLFELSQHIFPLTIAFSDKMDMFGPKNDIPVRTLRIWDDKALDALRAFYKKHGRAEHGLPMLDTPNYHVTVKKPQEQLAIEKLGLGKEIVIKGTLFCKQLGPHDPCFLLTAPAGLDKEADIARARELVKQAGDMLRAAGVPTVEDVTAMHEAAEKAGM